MWGFIASNFVTSTFNKLEVELVKTESKFIFDQEVHTRVHTHTPHTHTHTHTTHTHHTHTHTHTTHTHTHTHTHTTYTHTYEVFNSNNVTAHTVHHIHHCITIYMHTIIYLANQNYMCSCRVHMSKQGWLYMYVHVHLCVVTHLGLQNIGCHAA